jgi:isoleucyl-tRNA synthetase
LLRGATGASAASVFEESHCPHFTKKLVTHYSTNWLFVAVQKIGQHGSDFWFEGNQETLLDGIKLPNGVAAKKLKKCMDLLAVWIDSGNSHRAVLRTKTPLAWPADMDLEGSDQNRGWFQSSI